VSRINENYARIKAIVCAISEKNTTTYKMEPIMHAAVVLALMSGVDPGANPDSSYLLP
jgi:hypothetical protein